MPDEAVETPEPGEPERDPSKPVVIEEKSLPCGCRFEKLSNNQETRYPCLPCAFALAGQGLGQAMTYLNIIAMLFARQRDMAQVQSAAQDLRQRANGDGRPHRPRFET